MAKYRKPKRNDIILRIPTWASQLYLVLAIILLPWTIYLGATLPSHHLSAHWDVSWTGLDVGLVVAMLATGFFAYLRSIWIVIAASATGTLLLVDAWFDVLSERKVAPFHQALLAAFAFEIPLALMSYYVAAHALRQNTNPKG